jgi:hypothetical protein
MRLKTAADASTRDVIEVQIAFEREGDARSLRSLRLVPSLAFTALA